VLVLEGEILPGLRLGQAETRVAAHDASRAFHLVLARATRNSELVADGHGERAASLMLAHVRDALRVS
jgi:DNA-binding GntR family transcriptional regulator